MIIYFSELIFKTPVLFRFVVNGGPVKLVGLWIGWSCICIGTGTVLVEKVQCWSRSSHLRVFRSPLRLCWISPCTLYRIPSFFSLQIHLFTPDSTLTWGYNFTHFCSLLSWFATLLLAACLSGFFPQCDVGLIFIFLYPLT